MIPQHKDGPKALLLSVSFRSGDDVRLLVDSLSGLYQFPSLRALITDNASGEETVGAIRRSIAHLPNIHLLELPTNRGYFGGAKFALDHYLEQDGILPDWVVVCNPDTVIEDRQFLEKLFQLDSASVGMIAPRIVVPSLQLDQNPFMKERPGRLKRFTMRLNSHDYFLSVAWDWLFRINRWRKAKTAEASKEVPASTAEQVRIYAPHGSFMIFSRRFFEAGGYLDDQLFLFGEEISVGEICRNLGLAVVYDPSLTVIHNEHQSVGVGMTRTKFNYQRESIRHVLSKYLTTQTM